MLVKADDLCFHEHLKPFNSTDSSPGYRGKRESGKKSTIFQWKTNIKKNKTIYIGIFLNYESKILEFCMKIGVGQTIGFGELHSPCTWRDTVGSPPTYFWTLERLRRPDKFHHLSGASRSSTATSGQQEEWVPNPGFYRIFGKSMKINKNINFVCDSLPAHLPVGRWSLPRSGKSSGGAWEVMRSVTGGAVGVPLSQSPETCQGCCQNCPYQPTRRLGGLEVPKPIFGPTPIFIQDLGS